MTANNIIITILIGWPICSALCIGILSLVVVRLRVLSSTIDKLFSIIWNKYKTFANDTTTPDDELMIGIIIRIAFAYVTIPVTIIVFMVYIIIIYFDELVLQKLAAYADKWEINEN